MTQIAQATYRAGTHHPEMVESDGRRPSRHQRNISEREQWVSLIGGGACAIYGLTSRSSLSWIGLAAGASLLYRGWTGHCGVYDTLGVDTSKSHGVGVRAGRGRQVQRCVHVNRDRNEVYSSWRDLANLPKWMHHLESVQVLDDERSHWVARGPMGKQLSWDAEIITDRPGEVLAWQSLPGSQVHTAGSVHFTPPANGEGTELVVTLKYDPPGGATLAGLANLLRQGLEQELGEDLRRFKQMIEADGIAAADQRP